MTDKATDVTVTQADRKAADEQIGALLQGDGRERLLAGKLDSLSLVQAFARHRTASEQPASGEAFMGMFEGPMGVVNRPQYRKTALIEEWGEKLGDFDEAVKDLDTLDSLRAWAKHDQTFKDFGDLDDETLERFARAYDRYEQESFDLADLCRQAGLLGPKDHETNPLPLVRMFLPIE